MEKTVEVKELHSITLPSIGAPFAASWSEDRKIAVNTSAALHIIEVCPNPSFSSSGVSIRRSMVKPFSDMPTSETDIDTDALIWKLEQPDVYSMILDIQLAPKLTSSKPLEVRMKQAEWSPAGMFQDHRCLLACLTNVGCVKVLAPHQRGWPIVIDISAHWIKYCKEHWPPVNENLLNMQNDHQQLFHHVKTRAYQLNTTAITWSTLTTVPEKFTFLVLGQMSGQVVIWKLSSLKVSILNSSKLSPVLVVDTKLPRITALHWLNWSDDFVTLIVGNAEGCVKSVELTVKSGDISCTGMTDVWAEKDRMRVLCICSLPNDLKNDTRVIAVTKNSYIVTFLLKRNEVIAKCHRLVGNLNVSGLEMVDQDSFLATTHAGCVMLLHINHSKPQELTMEVEELTTNINWKKFACYGVAAGTKRGMWVIATSICKLYDHLVIRRPANLIFFYLHGKVDPMQCLVQNKSGRLSQYWEYLEIIRTQCLKKYLDLHHKYLENVKDLEKLSSYQLQIELWFAKITLTQTTATNNFDKQHQIGKHIHQLEQLLFCRHACWCISKLLKIPQCLSSDQLLTLFLMRAWIQCWLQLENLCWDTLKETARSKLDLPLPPEMPSRELCSLCQEEVIMQSSWRYAVCKKGHRLPRCSWTLRQCVKLPYLLCQVCSAIALPNDLLNEEFVCVFCNSPLFLDDKIKLSELTESQREPVSVPASSQKRKCSSALQENG
ncbi:uncharacterized protein [Anabrus simplex]|uniref:uncharacterized protein isoform X1 n=1 Tax=Anabrus simplex TaxID=316456 RepID=UPI0035A3241A